MIASLAVALAGIGMVQAQLAADNVIVVFNNAAQADIRAAGVQNQISAKASSSSGRRGTWIDLALC